MGVDLTVPCDPAPRVSTNGYAYLWLAEQQAGELWAHRDAWAAANGPIPAHLEVCHACDNPPCRELRHLFLGTRADNMRDAAAKGRIRGGARSGEANHNVKLSDNDVAEIRQRLADGESKHALARAFGVSRRLIQFIEQGRRRESVTTWD
jgi:hypothetical protein